MRRWPKRTTRKLRRICIAARLSARQNIQVAACSPNFLILEGIRRWDEFSAKILKKPLQWQDGHVIPPDAPGLGAELDEEVAARHPYKKTGTLMHPYPHRDPL